MNDRLVLGGENSRVFVAQLNRGYDTTGKVTVSPQVLWDEAGFDDQLIAAVGNNVSIENSVAVHNNVVYFGNSGGLIQGWDLSPLDSGGDPTQTLRFWMGDDTDASIVIDEDGMLYAAAEWERFNARSNEIGQVVKLDPNNPENPVVWSFHDPNARNGHVAGVWATPALVAGIVIVPVTDGDLYGLDSDTGEVLWQKSLPGPVWSSPVVIDDVLLQGDCGGNINAFKLNLDAPETEPELMWQATVTGCVESTPAVWNGRFYFGSRAGYLHAFE